MELVIGDKLYSTWSLRPWLVLKRCGADFTETVIRLNRYGPAFGLLGVVCMIFLRFPPRFAVAGLVAICVMLLLLNVLMLVWPLEIVREWQAAG